MKGENMRDIQRRYANILKNVRGTSEANKYETVAKHFAEIDNLAKPFGIRYSPDKHFDDYVRIVAMIENELVCRHQKFYWHVCSSCRRDKSQAFAYRAHCARRVQAILKP
jgi:hypothetical protein